MHSKVVPLECARSARKFLGIVVYRKNFASGVSNFFGGVSYRNFFLYRWCIVKKTLSATSQPSPALRQAAPLPAPPAYFLAQPTEQVSVLLRTTRNLFYAAEPTDDSGCCQSSSQPQVRKNPFESPPYPQRLFFTLRIYLK